MTDARLNIRDARTALGLSQAELGKRLGVTGRAVRLWEAGDRPAPQSVTLLLSIWLDPEVPDRLKPLI